jgi:UDP-N-acetylglucosamine 4-epimerase
VQKSYADVHYNDEVNITGFLNTFTATAETGVRTLIYASSCAVYGDNQQLPLSEKDCPAPLSPYAVSKFANDLYAGCLVSRYPEMRVFGLRLFNIFGPWQDPTGDYAAVIPKWIDLLLSGKQAIVFGDGRATRDFCYVDNVCALMAALAEAGAEKPRGGVYNIGTGQSYRLIELYQEIVAALREYGAISTTPGPEHRPWRDGDIVHSLADISKAQARLGFRTEVKLPEGIRRILREQYRLTAR